MVKTKYKKINSQLPINKIYKKFNSELCEDTMTFHDCELEILRNSIYESEKLRGEKIVNSEEVKNLLVIVENFIVRKKLVCYGGTAINNILPKFAQFYNRDIEVPDYDFFSANALEDAKELADIYHKAGYNDVEAKAGVHMGTFKVFVNFIPIADITLLNINVYKSILKESIIVSGIHYAPPNYLRMAVYLELSRPLGDVSRWEKVFQRLQLLNKYYPMKSKNCDKIDFQRKMHSNSDLSEKLYITARNSFIDQGVVFFGGYATSLYSKYMPDEEKHIVNETPDFDVLSEDPPKSAYIIKEALNREGFKKVKLVKHDPIGELIPEHFEVKVGSETIAYIYKPIACHSFNKIKIEDREINVATIDTILTFYLSFLYIDNKYYNKDRLLCMANFLFDVQSRNRLAQKGLLKRFTINCYGKQLTLEDMRSEKAEKHKELSDKHGSKEYEMWFLKYEPGQKNKHSKKTEKKRHKKHHHNKTNKKTVNTHPLLRILQKNTRKNN
jgi:hypothetical protein